MGLLLIWSIVILFFFINNAMNIPIIATYRYFLALWHISDLRSLYHRSKMMRFILNDGFYLMSSAVSISFVFLPQKKQMHSLYHGLNSTSLNGFVLREMRGKIAIVNGLRSRLGPQL